MDSPFPPRPRARIPGQGYWRFASDRLGTIERMAREHGDLVQLPAPGGPIFLLSDPLWIQRVLEDDHRSFVKARGLENAALVLGRGLLNSEGALHQRQRRLVMPAFHRQHLEGYAEHMSRYSQAHAERWQDGAVVDAAVEMMRLTRAIVGRTLFDVELSTDSPESAEIDRALGQLVGSFGAPGALFLPLILVERGWLPGTRGLPEARAVLDRLVYRLIDERRASGEDRGDLLSLLVHAVDAEGDGKGMSDLQVRDEVMTLFLAGHETTANALAWTWQLLGEHPEVEASLHAELDRVLGGRRPTMADLDNLVFTRHILTESMRLYPPAWIIGRRALVDYPIGDYGIPRGATLLMSQYVVQRDARWFDAPERFRPSRWAEESAADRPKYAYFPFGGGPRRCIGEAFAWMEGILILSTLAQRWRLRPVPGHPVVPDPLITLRPRHGIRVRLESRRREPASNRP